MNDAIALDRLQDARSGLNKAKAEYWAAIVAAKAHGLSNVAIGRALGVTEAAVRMWLRRNTR